MSPPGKSKFEENEVALLSDTESNDACIYWCLRGRATTGQHDNITKRRQG
jgi:hypothetical protein